MKRAVRGVNSEGLSTIALPVARAGPNFQANIKTAQYESEEMKKAQKDRYR
jgi:hypothetical protein